MNLRTSRQESPFPDKTVPIAGDVAAADVTVAAGASFSERNRVVRVPEGRAGLGDVVRTPHGDLARSWKRVEREVAKRRNGWRIPSLGSTATART